MSAGRGVALLLACLAAGRAAPGDGPADAMARGAAIYHEGAGLSATIAGGAPLPAPLAACVRCHRPSGHGVSEGDARAPALAAPVLFAPLAPRRDILLRDLYQERYGALAKAQARTPRARPAYRGADDLGRALRAGVDPGGAALSPAMPRYAISDADLAALTVWLRGLGAAPDPGWGARTVRFATVIAPDAPPGQAAATLAVIEAYVARHNREIARERARPGFSPGYKGEYLAARRDWAVDVWRLQGPPEGWGAQLAAAYAAAPPFALLGGVVPGDWAPVGAFCDAVALPCLFPQTGFPGADPRPGAGRWTLHLSAGLPGEAALLAGALAAEGLTRVEIAAGAGAGAQRLAALLATTPGVSTAPPFQARALIMAADEARAALAAADGAPAPSFAAGGLIAAPDGGLAPDLACALRVAWTFADPGRPDAQRLRARKWLRARRVDDPAWERAQLETLLALDAAEHAVIRLVDRPSRAFFVEAVEHLAESGIDPGVYRRFSLGPGQRVAARGARMLTPGQDCAAR